MTKNETAKGLIVFLLLMISGWLFPYTGAHDVLSSSLWDFFVQTHAGLKHEEVEKRLEDFPIVLLSLDDASYEKINLRWPWGREVYADVLREVASYEPAVVAIDLGLMGESADPESDRDFGRAMDALPAVVLASYYGALGNLVLPLESLRNKAAGVGFANVPMDRDAVVRKSQLVMVKEGVVDHSSFSLAALLAAYKKAPDDFRSEKAKGLLPQRTIHIDLADGTGRDLVIRTDEKHSTRILFETDPSRYPRIPFWKAFAGSEELEMVRGKIVLVSIESPVMHDYVWSPWGHISGGSLQVAYLDAYLHDGEVLELPQPFIFIIYLAAVALCLFFLVRARRWIAVLFGAGLALFVVAGSFGLLHFFHVFVNPALPLAGILFIVIILASYEELSRLLTILELQKQLSEDPLTKAASYRYLELFMNRKLKKGEKQTELCFFILDIDYFKQINDTRGHEAGNLALKALVLKLKNGARHGDIVARFGGDEFCLCLFGVSQPVSEKVIKRVQESIRSGDAFEKGVPKFSISAGGIFGTSRDFTSFDDLLRRADAVLYEAKENGRDQCIIRSSEEVPATLESDQGERTRRRRENDFRGQGPEN